MVFDVERSVFVQDVLDFLLSSAKIFSWFSRIFVI